ncbi:trans-sulfuration enzyme family protein [Paraclostridium dentum]|uniref:trans-sulfuration enzyme family protein n=1 Tax=Paraclostridium dentum TaxID=2662455 RepID=UPI003AFFF75C
MRESNYDETMLLHYGEDKKDYQGAVVPPIYQNSLFTFEDWDSIDRAFDDPVNNCIYTRGKNPTVSIVEEKLSKLAGGEKAKLFTSGMAAISSAIMHFAKPNGHIITLKNIYGPANNFMGSYLKEKMNIEVTYISGKDVNEFSKNIKENTCLIYLESPSSVVFSLQDINEISKLAKEHNIKTIIDNTWATPIYQKPLKMGIDLEVHSCSKYIGGHSDIVAGVIIGSEKDIKDIFEKEHALYGGKIAPFEAWLIMRSLRTLPIRLAKHQENALQVAKFLESHPKVKKVYYPGIESFEQYELGKKQMNGYTGLMAIDLDCKDLDKIKAFVNRLEYFYIGVSWGGFESLVYAPAISYLKEMTPDKFDAMGISLGSIRLSIGLENYNDLICDLEKALSIL